MTSFVLHDSFDDFVAERLSAEAAPLTGLWAERLPVVDPGGARSAGSPTLELSLVLQRVALSLRTGDLAALVADPQVTMPIDAFARSRHDQGRGPEEIIRELELLAEVLDDACLQWVRICPRAPAPESVARVAGRLNRAVLQLGQVGVRALRQSSAVDPDVDRRIREFAEALVHELNSPLAAAESAALMLENDQLVPTSQDRRRFSGLIQRNLRRARAVIGDLRELTFAESPRRLLPMDRVLSDVLTALRDSERIEGLRVEIVEPVPDVQVDAARLELVLVNLIGNAAKYADPSRGITWVRVGMHCENGPGSGWCLEVSDNGLGIPHEHHQRVFDRFFRAHPNHAEGTGLGLSIVREAVRQLGGRIELQSQPGVGTTFRIFLPPSAEYRS